MKEGEIDYGPVFVFRGRLKGRVLYYDDDEGRTAICYAGHPVDFVRTYDVPVRFLREPLIDDLLTRRDAIWRELSSYARNNNWPDEPRFVHELWSEKSIIDGILYERRMLGEMEQIVTDKTIFLCHSSIDKGTVRMINDDLRRLGATTWLDENKIKVGDDRPPLGGPV